MLRRLHTGVVYALAALLISTSFAQVVAAAHIEALPAPLAAHGADHRAHHDHLQALANENTKRDCLKFCSEAIADDYLTTAPWNLTRPKFLTNDLGPALFLSHLATTYKPILYYHSVRGPPGTALAVIADGLRGVLLLNARLRN